MKTSESRAGSKTNVAAKVVLSTVINWLSVEEASPNSQVTSTSYYAAEHVLETENKLVAWLKVMQDSVLSTAISTESEHEEDPVVEQPSMLKVK